jgi:nitric oxide dioxygenase
MKAMKSHLRELGVPEAQTYYEFFGPAEALQ